MIRVWVIDTNFTTFMNILQLSISQAISQLKSNNLIILPTHNTFQIASLVNPQNVQKLINFKGSPETFLPTYLFHSTEQLLEYFDILPSYIQTLLSTFTPGPLVIKLAANLCKLDLFKDAQTVSCYIPHDKVTLELLKELNQPLAISSANPHRLPPAINLEMLTQYFDTDLNILQNYNTEIDFEFTAVEPTVLDCTETDHPQLLRPGSIHHSEFKTILPNIHFRISNFLPKKSPFKIKLIKDISVIKEIGPKHKITVLGTKEKLREHFSLSSKEYFHTKQIDNITVINLGSQTNLTNIAKNLYHKIFQANQLNHAHTFLLDQNWGKNLYGDLISHALESYLHYPAGANLELNTELQPNPALAIA